MKLQIFSDLHLELMYERNKPKPWIPPPSDADVVILAGDIHKGERGVFWAAKNFKQPVILVAGNHEFWGGSLGHTAQKIKEAADATPNVRFLQEEELILDGVRFLGTTLWTDYRLTGNQPLAELDAHAIMNDFKKIRTETFSKLRPFHLVKKHSEARQFLERSLEKDFSGKTVIVSHHAPCELSIAGKFNESSKDYHLNSSYASRLDFMMGEKVNLWVHGHTHDSFDYDVYGTRVVCNPRGYESPVATHLNPGFNPNLIIEL